MTPPREPRIERPTAIAVRRNAYILLARYISSPGAHVVRRVAHFDADAVPASVLRALRGVAHVVLLAQFIRDAGGGRIQVAREADDLGAPAAVVGDVAQRGDVDAIVVAAVAPARVAGAAGRTLRRLRRRRRRLRPAPGDREGERTRLTALAAAHERRAGPLEAGRRVVVAHLRLRRGIDADRVDQHFGLANQLLHREHVGAAAGVVAVGDDHDRLLAVVPLLRHLHRVRDRVVERRAAARLQAIDRVADDPFVARPALHQLWRVVEAEEKDFVVHVEQLRQEALQRFARGTDLLAIHAAAGVDDNAETDGHAFGAEMRHRLHLLVVVDAEVLARQAGDEAAALVGDGCVHVDQHDAGAELERRGVLRRRLLLRRLRLLLLRRSAPLGGVEGLRRQQRAGTHEREQR